MKRVSSLVLALALIGLASPASAHSAVVYSNPGPNQSIGSGPQRVKLSFSLPILRINEEFQAGLQLLDSKGQKLSPICSKVTDKSMEGVYDFESTGIYQLTWRVVAGDGHIVASAYRFEVTDSNQPSKDAPQLCEEVGPDSSSNPLLSASESQFSEPIASTSVLQIVAFLGLFALLIVLCWVLVNFLRSRKN